MNVLVAAEVKMNITQLLSNALLSYVCLQYLRFHVKTSLVDKVWEAQLLWKHR